MNMFSIDSGLRLDHESHWVSKRFDKANGPSTMQQLEELGYSREEAYKLIAPSYLLRRELDGFLAEASGDKAVFDSLVSTYLQANSEVEAAVHAHVSPKFAS